AFAASASCAAAPGVLASPPAARGARPRRHGRRSLPDGGRRRLRMTAILALDQGTTSSRAVVFDESGAQLGMAQRELRQLFPRPGSVEHDPIEICGSHPPVAVAA